jgi:diadenosine tetraphosphate (Ap4A) HIT family hydrolase
MNNCVFCRILAGEMDSSRVLEGGLIVAFLDIGPINQGHTLVVPRRHVEAFTDLTPAEVRELGLSGQRVAAALKKVLPGCEGVTLSLADGKVAGQEVPHAHLHVIPRYAGDGFGWRRHGRPEDRAALDAMASKIEGALTGVGRASGSSPAY